MTNFEEESISLISKFDFIFYSNTYIPLFLLYVR